MIVLCRLNIDRFLFIIDKELCHISTIITIYYLFIIIGPIDLINIINIVIFI